MSAVIMIGGKPPKGDKGGYDGGGDAMSTDDGEDSSKEAAEQEAAGAFMRAVAQKDRKALVDAFEALVEACYPEMAKGD